MTRISRSRGSSSRRPRSSSTGMLSTRQLLDGELFGWRTSRRRPSPSESQLTMGIPREGRWPRPRRRTWPPSRSARPSCSATATSGTTRCAVVGRAGILRAGGGRAAPGRAEKQSSPKRPGDRAGGVYERLGVVVRSAGTALQGDRLVTSTPIAPRPGKGGGQGDFTPPSITRMEPPCAASSRCSSCSVHGPSTSSGGSPSRHAGTPPSVPALWPILGIIFAPWTTMIWVIVSPGGVTGIDWLWVGLAIVVDVGFWSGGAWATRTASPVRRRRRDRTHGRAHHPSALQPYGGAGEGPQARLRREEAREVDAPLQG